MAQEDEPNLHAGAKVLYEVGTRHGWFPRQYASMEEFKQNDPIGYDEFLDVVDKIYQAMLE